MYPDAITILFSIVIFTILALLLLCIPQTRRLLTRAIILEDQLTQNITEEIHGEMLLLHNQIDQLHQLSYEMATVRKTLNDLITEIAPLAEALKEHDEREEANKEEKEPL